MTPTWFPFKFPKSTCWLSILLASSNADLTRADNFTLDRQPVYTQGSAHVPEPFNSPNDPKVCSLLLEDLQQLARSGVSKSCQQPGTARVEEPVQSAVWEDLDPDRYPDLFRPLVSQELQIGDGAPTTADLDWQRGLVKGKQFVFRRAKVTLSGYVTAEGELRAPATARPFQIVQYGGSRSHPVDRRTEARCTIKGSELAWSETPDLYLVSDDLQSLYGHLFSIADGAGYRTVVLINGRPYVEETFHSRDVRLFEIKLDFPVLLEPVCLYHFRKAP